MDGLLTCKQLQWMRGAAAPRIHVYSRCWAWRGCVLLCDAFSHLDMNVLHFVLKTKSKSVCCVLN